MRITIPDLPQLAQTRQLRGSSMSADTSGLRTLYAGTARAFEAAGNAADTFYNLEMEERENTELAAAVTQYGTGLDDASDAAAKAKPTDARSVFETLSAQTLADVRGGLTNKQARLRFDLHAAGKYTAQYTEQRKLGRKRLLEGKVFRATNRVQELNRIAGDINLPVLERSQARRALFGMNVPGAPVEIGVIEQAVIDGTYDGEAAATLLHESRVKILTNLATGFVMQSDDPELTAMSLQQVGEGFEKTPEEVEIRSMLSSLKATTRAEILQELGNRATEIATDRAGRRTRINKQASEDNEALYNSSFLADVTVEELRNRQKTLASWDAYTPVLQEKFKALIAKRAATDGVEFASEDLGDSIVKLQDHLSDTTLTAEVLAKYEDTITQTTYEKFSAAIRTQNNAGFTRANDLIMREFKYEKNKVLIQGNKTDPLVRASQAAAQSAQGDMLEWLQTNPKATPAESFAKAQELIKLERQGFYGLILDARDKWLKSPGTVSFVGALTSEDPLAELEEKIANGDLQISDWTVAATLTKLRDYHEQLGGN
jgi:hypothetical protein